MKRWRASWVLVASIVSLAAWLGAATAAQAAGGGYDGWPGKKGMYAPLCSTSVSLCADPSGLLNGYYVGHDEPSVEFKSPRRGSGNDMTYVVTLPVNPHAQPSGLGPIGPTWDFQLRSAFWFGLTVCDTESAPEYTKTCRPDSDSNNLVGANPRSRDYIGKHPGNAYMELQFYEPGYVEQFEGFGCTATQYCAAMTIDSRTLDQNRGAPASPGEPGLPGTENTAACDDYVLGGPEPINWAYVTRSGRSQAPANPLFTGTLDNPNFSAVNPDPSRDLMMNPGDRILIHMHDTPAGFRADMTDLTTRQSGSMTASIANGFGHILYTPNSSTCQEAPYAFHPEYSTAEPRGNTWSAHTYNVAYSDEIGHFENCQALDANFNCTQPGTQDPTLDEDDDNNFCVPGTDSTLVKINGCFSADADWDNQSYRNDWPGTPGGSPRPTPLLFTSPLSDGRNYPTIAFETDLPRIEASDSQDNPPFCDQMTGANCVNPPNGAQFYPFFTTGIHDRVCTWQEGGNNIPGTIDRFGGSSTTEYGPLLRTLYPFPVFTPGTRIRNFNSGDQRNPCPVEPLGESSRRRG